MAAGQPIEGRVRGTTEGARRLLDVFRKLLSKTPGPDQFLFEINVSCELDQAISDDESFWPRIILLPGDRLLLRGRNPEEVVRFIQVFMRLANSDYAVPEVWSTKGREIEGGIPHFLALQFDPQTIRRIAAKVAYALFLTVANGTLDADRDSSLRDYILGLSDCPDEPVFEAPYPLTTTTSRDPHYVVLSPTHDPQSVIVNFYSYAFRVELGPEGRLSEPIVMICDIDGSGMRRATSAEAQEIFRSVSGMTFATVQKDNSETAFTA